ncbi:MAG: ThiF family adenylyltransferase [Candidatus Gastranaerophilaceae bacterium]
MDNNDIFARNKLYWGVEAQNKIKNTSVAVFGLGGVGGYTVEMLARSGVEKFIIVDFDTVSISNINRQIIALNSTIGQKKTDLFEKRLKDINFAIEVIKFDDFYTKDFTLPKVDYVVDAIDSMRSKVDLLTYCVTNKIPVISSMGAGNRINPEELYICDIANIQEKKAPFISNILYQLNKRGINSGIDVVLSHEKPFVQEKISEVEKIITKNGEVVEFNKIIPSSTPFVASCAGIFMASHVIRKICMV